MSEAEELRKAVELARRIVEEVRRDPHRGELWSVLERALGSGKARAPETKIVLNRGCSPFKAMRTTRRTGAVPPIVTVIIVVASVVAAALAAYFIYATTARGVRQVSLTVIGQPTLYAKEGGGVELRVTFKNDGTADVDLLGSKIYVQDKDKKAVEFELDKNIQVAKLVPGNSTALRYVSDKASLDQFPDGALAMLQTKDGYQISFAVAKP